ncbi:MAG: hypothetical protein H0Z33_00930 [Bacillaceae bacterium]|nr:hypothetical protein [Bacillaceae bacterium]
MGFKKYLKQRVREKPKLEKQIMKNPLLVSRLKSSYEKSKQEAKVSRKKNKKSQKSSSPFGLKLPPIQYDDIRNSMNELNNFMGALQEFMQTSDNVKKMFSNQQSGQSTKNPLKELFKK